MNRPLPMRDDEARVDAAAGMPRRRGSPFELIGALGAGAQASVPGFYAWGVTVAPAVFARGVHWSSSLALWSARVLAFAGVASLLLAIVMEPRWRPRARYVAVWGLALTSGFAWLLVPATTLGPLRLDFARGTAGMVGWGLFAFACAAPALK